MNVEVEQMWPMINRTEQCAREQRWSIEMVRNIRLVEFISLQYSARQRFSCSLPVAVTQSRESDRYLGLGVRAHTATS